MTLAEHAAKTEVQKALKRLRIRIVGHPRPASPLGFVGIAWGLEVLGEGLTEGVVLTNDEGLPLIALTAIVSVN